MLAYLSIPQVATLPKHLQLGVTLKGMRELLLQLPSDAVEQVNAKMEQVNAKMVKKGKPPARRHPCRRAQLSPGIDWLP